jgi:type I restriction enzyme S subunit
MRCEERPPREGEFGVVKVSAVTWGRFDPTQSKTLPSHYDPPQKAQIQFGDLLISRANTLELVGAAVLVESHPENLFLSDKILRLVMDEDVKKWTLIFLRSKYGRKQIEELATGNQLSMRNISQDALRSIQQPLPPVAEQRRIVAKLAALTARLERAREELARITALGVNLRERALFQAFRGELTALWRNDHALLPPVIARSTAEIRKKFHSSSSMDKFPFEIPSTWHWLRLPELGEIDRGKSSHRPRNDPRLFGGNYPFIQTGDVRAASQYLTKYNTTYSEFGLEQSRKWPSGTVCITIAANIAETCILRIEACFPDSIVGFTADTNRAEPEFVEYFIRTAKAEISRFAPATAQKNINLETLSSVVIPTPPIEEQREIIRRLDLAFTRADRLVAEASRGRELIDRLESAILAKAFRGELVPQDLKDGSASALLDRIRAAAPKLKRGRQVTT